MTRTTNAIIRSNLDTLTSPDNFLWMTGIEDTFVYDPHKVTGRILDEYELTGHYERWREDLERVRELEVGYVRYGIPWYRVNPAYGQWDWEFSDKTLRCLLDKGIQPVVDLVHYGTPAWMQDGFLNPDYPRYVAEYASKVAERYKGEIYWYTPLNEPRVTAWYCGRLGWWPPYRRGESGFLQVLVAVSEGIQATQRALLEVDPEIVCCHVDATDLYSCTNPEDQPLADWKQQIVFLPLDLVSGRVDEAHPCRQWLLKNGIVEDRLESLQKNSVMPDVIGLNMYPMFTHKVITRTESGRRTRMVRGRASMVRDLGRLYGQRYRRPLMITETASDGTVEQRQTWLDETVREVRALREEGVPMVGYTWWPMFSLVAWAYRQTVAKPIDAYLVQMGLWDLAPGLDRIRTPLVDRYRDYAASVATSVGLLRNKEVQLVS